MQAFWTEYGFFLWGLTTALAIIALAWLAWSTFSQTGEDEADETAPAGPEAPAEWAAQLQELAEGAPVMRASLGRALQHVGLERYVDTTGAPAFALAVASARGDGFLLVSSVRGGLTAKPIQGWGPAPKALFSAEEQLAVDQARAQIERQV